MRVISNKNLFLLFTFVICTTNFFGQKTFYISQKGNDKNSGESISQPWKTLKSFQPGNTYLFRASDTFYLNIPRIKNEKSLPIKVSSYGKGQKPLISGYRIVDPALFSLTNIQHVWKVPINTQLLGGVQFSKNENVGFLMIDSKIFGNKCRQFRELKSQWDFMDDSGYLYVYSVTRPKSNIYFTCDGTIIALSSNLKISNLKIEGSGGHGIQGANVNNVIIQDIDIKNIGGSYLKGFRHGFTRYGNGIEFWEASDNCLVDNCSISNVYDAALTMQGRNESSVFSNIIMKNNKISYCEQSFEFWQEKSNSGFRNCLFTQNSCSYAGFSWSHTVRPDTKVGVHLLIYFPLLGNVDIRIVENKFKYARTAFMRLPTDFHKQTSFLLRKNNIKNSSERFVYYSNGKLQSFDSVKAYF